MAAKANRLRRRRIIQLSAFQDDLCFHCGKPMRLRDPEHTYDSDESNDDDYASFDHAVPAACGGSNRIENLVIAHRSCNSARHHAPLSADDLARVAALNEKRKDLIEEADKGDEIPELATYGGRSAPAIALHEYLSALEGRDGVRVRRHVNRFIGKFQTELSALRQIVDDGCRRRFAELLLRAVREEVHHITDIKARYLTDEVLVVLYRKFLDVSRKPPKSAESVARRRTQRENSRRIQSEWIARNRTDCAVEAR